MAGRSSFERTRAGLSRFETVTVKHKIERITHQTGQLQYATPKLLAARGGGGGKSGAPAAAAAGGGGGGATASGSDGTADQQQQGLLVCPKEIARVFWEESPQVRPVAVQMGITVFTPPTDSPLLNPPTPCATPLTPCHSRVPPCARIWMPATIHPRVTPQTR